MKNFATILVAIILFGLCLVEKELKQRAIETQLAEGTLSSEMKERKEQPIVLATPVLQGQADDQYFTLKLQPNNLAVSDSIFNSSTSSLEKPL